MLLKRQNKSEEPGIVQVFKMKHSAKIRKNGVPLIFLAVPKKGAPATYYKYEDLKESHPHFLFDFFEKKITTKPSNQIVQQVEKQRPVIVPPPQQKKQKRESNRDNKEIRQSREIRELKELKELKDRKEFKQVIKEKEKEPPVKFMHERQYYKESISKQREQRQANPVESSKELKEFGEKRPVRSCRYRNDLKRRDQFQPRQEARQSIKNFSEEDPRSDPQDQDEQENDEEQYRRKSYKKIIDYDGLIKEEGKYEFVSPAVIPTSKAKYDISIPFPLPPILPFKDSERDQLSSEEFKESEESEFILDDRGKQRRRKDRIAKEQERLNKKRKSKKLKKKKKSGSRH